MMFKMSLLEACKNGDLELLKTLLEADTINLNIIDENGSTALLWASKSGHDSCVKALLEAGADPSITNKYYYNSLMIASQNGYYLCVKALLEAGADPNVKYSDGSTALVWASWYGHKKCIKLLLKAGANPFIMNNLLISNRIYASKNIKKIIKKVNILKFLKEYYEECKLFKLFNYNLIRELIIYL